MAKKYETTTNVVTMTGTLFEDAAYAYTSYDEKFYTATLQVKRAGSDNSDYLPITVSEKLIDVTALTAGTTVTITGQFRSFNKIDEETQRRHLILSVFCRDIVIADDDAVHVNSITFSGYICKEPKFRKTPKGREITDLLVAVNRSYGRTDYIPCIAWGRNAKFASGMEVGTHLDLAGRIQSREYSKKVDEDTYVKKTVYEVSLGTVSIVVDPEDFADEEISYDNVEPRNENVSYDNV